MWFIAKLKFSNFEFHQWRSVNKNEKKTTEKEGTIPLEPVDGAETQYEVKSGKPTYTPSLLKALAKTFGPQYLVGSFFKLFHDILMFISPMLLK